MEYAVSGKAAAKLKVDCLVVPLSKGATDLPVTLPEATRELIAEYVKDGDFSGKKQETLLLHNPPALTARRLLLVGTGVENGLSVQAFLQLATTAARAVAATGASSAALLLTDLAVKDQDALWLVREGSRALADAQYRFDEYR